MSPRCWLLLSNLLLAPLFPARAGECILVLGAGAGGSASFWQVVGEGAKAAGRELGVTIHYLLPADETDQQAQVRMLQQLDRLHCRALVLAPNAPERGAEVSALQRRGIPTIYIDRAAPGGPPVALVATDNLMAGRLAGEQVVRRLRRTGRHRVLLMRMQHGVASTDAREQGFLGVVQQAGLTVVAQPYLGLAERTAHSRARRVIAAQRGKFDAVFAPNEVTADATLQALQQQHLAGKVLMIGFDLNSRLYDALRQRTIAALVLQRPFQMGYVGVTLAYRAMQGVEHAPQSVDSGTTLLTHDNLNLPGILFFSAFRGLHSPTGH